MSEEDDALARCGRPLPLPKHIKVERGIIAKSWGSSYLKDWGTTLYAEMNGGWTAAELRAIADDLDARAAAAAAPKGTA